MKKTNKDYRDYKNIHLKANNNQKRKIKRCKPPLLTDSFNINVSFISPKTMSHLLFLSLYSTPIPHDHSPLNTHTYRHKQTHKPPTISSLLKSIKFGDERERGIIPESVGQSMQCKNLILCTGEIVHLLLLNWRELDSSIVKPRERERQKVTEERERKGEKNKCFVSFFIL